MKRERWTVVTRRRPSKTMSGWAPILWGEEEEGDLHEATEGDPRAPSKEVSGKRGTKDR